MTDETPHPQPMPPKFWHLLKEDEWMEYSQRMSHTENWPGILLWFSILGQFASWLMPVYAWAVHAWWCRWFP